MLKQVLHDYCPEQKHFFLTYIITLLYFTFILNHIKLPTATAIKHSCVLPFHRQVKHKKVKNDVKRKHIHSVKKLTETHICFE